MKKIGDIGFGGSGLSAGNHNNGDGSSLKELFTAIREELDALYAKLNADAGVTDTDYESVVLFEK